MESREYYSIKTILNNQPLTDFEYDDRTLQYLISLLTKNDKIVLLDIYKKTRGDDYWEYQKTKVRDFSRLRRKYEISWGRLEAQGLIKIIPLNIGKNQIFVVTDNGNRAVEYIKATLVDIDWEDEYLE